MYTQNKVYYHKSSHQLARQHDVGGGVFRRVPLAIHAVERHRPVPRLALRRVFPRKLHQPGARVSVQ
jgi:hypothetical protein